MGKVDHEDVEKALAMFDALDTNRTGVLELREQRGKLANSFSAGQALGHAELAEQGAPSGSRMPSLRAPLLRGEVEKA